MLDIKKKSMSLNWNVKIRTTELEKGKVVNEFYNVRDAEGTNYRDKNTRDIRVGWRSSEGGIRISRRRSTERVSTSSHTYTTDYARVGSDVNKMVG